MPILVKIILIRPLIRPAVHERVHQHFGLRTIDVGWTHIQNIRFECYGRAQSHQFAKLVLSMNRKTTLLCFNLNFFCELVFKTFFL